MSDQWTTPSVLSVSLNLALRCFKNDTIRTLRASVHGDTRKKGSKRMSSVAVPIPKWWQKYEAEEKNRSTPHIYEQNHLFSCLVFSFLFYLAFPFSLLFFFPCCSEGLYLILQAEKFFLHFKHAYLLCSKDKAEFKFGGVCSIWLFSSDKIQSILLWSQNFFCVSFYWQSLTFQYFCFNLIAKSQIDRVALICVC